LRVDFIVLASVAPVQDYRKTFVLSEKILLMVRLAAADVAEDGTVEAGTRTSPADLWLEESL
jgi:hypothetical protein